MKEISVETQEFDRQVALRTRKRMPVSVIAGELGCSRGRVYAARKRLVETGAIDGDQVKNVIAGYRQERGPDGLTARFRAVRDGLVAGKTQAQIGVEMGVSKQRVGQITALLEGRGHVVRAGGKWEVRA